MFKIASVGILVSMRVETLTSGYVGYLDILQRGDSDCPSVIKSFKVMDYEIIDMLSKKLKDVKDPIIRYGAKIWASKSEIDGVIFTIYDISVQSLEGKY